MTAENRESPGRLLWWTLAVVALVRLATMGLYPLTDTTEARYAEVARKMVELGDWVTPWYDYGVPFWAKPPLSTWFTAASIKILGANEFAARLPYFLLAVLIAWLVWDWMARVSARAALLAVTLLSGTLLYLVASAAVMTDLALVLGTTLAMRGFWTPFEEPRVARPNEQWLLFIGLGIGMLAKGPIALVLTGIPVVIWATLTRNNIAVLKNLPWIRGTLLAVAIALPWYWLAEIRTPGFWEYFFIGEHWKRFTVTGWTGDKYGTAHATTRGAIWIYALAACLPWTLLLPFLAWGRRIAAGQSAASAPGQSYSAGWITRHRRNIYLWAWAIAPCLFFTLSGNILWTYVLPALPALAMLTSEWLAKDERVRKIDLAVSAGLLAMALLVAGYFVNEQIQGSWKTAKDVVLAYRERNIDSKPLIFLGELPYSASFYSRGKATSVSDHAALAERIAQSSTYIALTPAQAKDLPVNLKAMLAPVASSGAYSLYLTRRTKVSNPG